MENIGRYNSVVCMKCSDAEYRRVRMNGLDRKDYIYVIDNPRGTERPMVRDNKIIGYYDGHRVEDVYRNEDYLKTPKVSKNEMKNEMANEESRWNSAPTRQTSSSPGTYNETELKVVDIDFSKYSRVVDEFFEALS